MSDIISPLEFIDVAVKKNELGQPFLLMDHQREILGMAFAFDEDGRLPFDTVIYSTVKKDGKTTINAAIGLWWAFTQEPPNEILLIANDLEQAQGRVFKAMAGIIDHNPQLAEGTEIQTRQIILSNGTTITALASEYAGAAGSNHGLTSWDELWGYTSESSRRLWEELTPIPTRKNSIRFISSYAGWENESALFQELYKQVVSSEEHPEGQGERLHPDLPIYANREARIFAYWDHEPRMPWQTTAYYQTQKRTLRPATYLRLHENRWTTAESIFITPELWDPCVDSLLSPLLPTREHRLFVGVDAGIKHDTAAVVAVRWDGDKLALASHRIWKPTREEPLDLEGTIEAHLRDLHQRYRVKEILCDPYQLHRSITTLQAAGLPIREFPQTSGNTTLMGQTLFDLLNGKNLTIYPAEDLRAQALNTVAIESTRGWRIAKEKASKKIDAIVALSMAACSALERGRPRAYEMFPVIHKGESEGVRAGEVGMDDDEELFWREGMMRPGSESEARVAQIIEGVCQGRPVDWKTVTPGEKRTVELQLRIMEREAKIDGHHEQAGFFKQQIDSLAEMTTDGRPDAPGITLPEKL